MNCHTPKPTAYFPLLFSVLLFSCHKNKAEEPATETENVQITLNVTIGSQSLVMGNTYTNPQSESFSVRAFKFYINAIDLINDSTGKSFSLDRNQYFLVNAADTASLHIRLKAGSGSFNRIAFTIGVDSARNVSGVQTGALDPANGMFWTWNSGYIMAKLEGYSPASNQVNNLFEYHIGGFRSGENAVKRISLALPSGSAIQTENGKTSRVQLLADVNKWFSGAHNISIAAIPVCMTPGAVSVKFAENYAGMFSIGQVNNQ